METDWNLLAKYVRGESTPEETQRLIDWANESETHRLLLEKAQRTWQTSGDVYQAYTPDVATAWNKVDRRISETPVVAIRPKANRRPWLLRIAAAVVITAGLAYLVRFFAPPGGFGLAETRTEARETRQVQLADGTQVWLNEHTTLRYLETFDDSVRRVYLRGEAFFKVARNEQQPFLIESQGALTRVLGTSFNVEAPDGDPAVVVTVVSGVVALSSQESQKTIVLRKDEQGVYRRSDQSIRYVEAIPPNILAWQTHRMTFANQSLAEVGQVLEEVYQKSVSIDPTLATLQLTARFDDQPLDEVLEVVALTLDVAYRVEENTIYFERIEK